MKMKLSSISSMVYKAFLLLAVVTPILMKPMKRKRSTEATNLKSDMNLAHDDSNEVDETVIPKGSEYEAQGMAKEYVKVGEIAARSYAPKRYRAGGFKGIDAPIIEYPESMCEETEHTCDESSPHRTIDGTCNNLAHPTWGSAMTVLRRLVNSDYYDGVSVPRGGHSGTDVLPNPRTVSLAVHRDFNKPDPKITHMLAIFGQFLDHDITLTPEADELIDCCEVPEDEDCKPIPIPMGDPFYSTLNPPVTCLDFHRSSDTECYTIRQQLNGITAFIDGSNLYGSTDEQAAMLREFSGGRLLMSDDSLLPEMEGKEQAGDIRAREHPALVSMHALWLREHNRLADWAYMTLPDCNDECAYQHARRLVIAEMQNIVYTEWLPLVLGDRMMREYQLNSPREQENMYDSNLDPSIINSFATAAFRFGHTLIQGVQHRINKHGKLEKFKLQDHFFKTEMSKQDGAASMYGILEGMISQPSQSFDEHVSEQITNFLFKDSEMHEHEHFGSDLIARNIHRGREHGIRGYTAYRELFGLSPIVEGHGPPEIHPHKWKKLCSLYDSPDDMDLFTAGLMETAYEGVVGPTFGNIIANQFKRLKYGDRHFYTHCGQAGSLDFAEYKWVMSRTMRDILCDNTKIERLQSNVFMDNNSVRWSCARLRHHPYPKQHRRPRSYRPRQEAAEAMEDADSTSESMTDSMTTTSMTDEMTIPMDG